MNDQPTSIPAEAAPPAAVPALATAAAPGPAASRWRWTGSLLVRGAVVLVAGALVALFVIRWDEWVGANTRQTTDDAYVRGDITPLSAQVEGYLRAVPVTDFQLVKAGDLLIEIEDQDYLARVAQAEADLAGAEAAVANLKSRKDLQHAQITEAGDVIAATQADVDRTHEEAVRQRTLLATTYGTQQKVEQADADEKRFRATLARNLAQLEGQRRQMGVLDTEELQLRAEVKARRAALDLARINLSYTKILAPVDGMVGERGVRTGQYVRVGTQVISVVPLKNVWVIGNYKETQLTHVAIGQPAEVRVDTFPGIVVKGWVDSISPASGSQFALLPPDNATGNFTKVVQRIPVKIRLDPANPLAGRLRPGMSVIATILTDRTAPKP
jgi:membrane fusion protein (multidrug efflux system)